MVKYKLYYTKQAQKDAKKIAAAGLKNQVIKILDILETRPFSKYPPFEKLLGDLSGSYSRRINLQHRLIYQIYEKEKAIKIIRMWTHYE